MLRPQQDPRLQRRRHQPEGTTSVATSATKIALGSAAKASKKPRLLYTGPAANVGKTFKAYRGVWSPSATYSYNYIWKRGTRSIKQGSTATTYKATAADKGQTLTLTVQAKRTGYATGTYSYEHRCQGPLRDDDGRPRHRGHPRELMPRGCTLRLRLQVAGATPARRAGASSRRRSLPTLWVPSGRAQDDGELEHEEHEPRAMPTGMAYLRSVLTGVALLALGFVCLLVVGSPLQASRDQRVLYNQFREQLAERHRTGQRAHLRRGSWSLPGRRWPSSPSPTSG